MIATWVKGRYLWECKELVEHAAALAHELVHLVQDKYQHAVRVLPALFARGRLWRLLYKVLQGSQGVLVPRGANTPCKTTATQ